ncbi:MAG: dihydrofolate reductase family protein [Acidimicrobiia bacterium]
MPDSDVVASLAVTLDGYVAMTDGSVDFLEKYPLEDFDFDAFTDSIGALIMGSTTYTETLQWGWMWGDRPTTVLTTQTGLPVPSGADIRFTAMHTPDAIRSFSAETPKRLWVFGGGRVVTDGLRGGAIDTLDITVMPEALGSGIPLFTSAYDGPMRLIESVVYPNSALRLVYDTRFT